MTQMTAQEAELQRCVREALPARESRTAAAVLLRLQAACRATRSLRCTHLMHATRALTRGVSGRRLGAESERYDAAALSARADAAAAAAELAELRERLAHASGAGGAGLLFRPLAVGADEAGAVLSVTDADPRQLAAQLRAAAASAEATAGAATSRAAQMFCSRAAQMRCCGVALTRLPHACTAPALEARLQARLAALSAEALRLSSAAAQEHPPREL